MRAGRLFGLVATLLSAVGCNSILGNDAPRLAMSGGGGSNVGGNPGTGGAGANGAPGSGGGGGIQGAGGASGTAGSLGAASGGGASSGGGTGGSGAGGSGGKGAGGATDGGVDAAAGASDAGDGPPRQDAGFDSITDIGAPHLIAPLSTATVTSHRPTFHWVLAPGTDGAHVQICYDRACTKPVVAFDASGANGAPSSNLPAGVLYWRASGRASGAVGTSVSPTWQLVSGKLSAPVDTSWGTTLDPNGDGIADVLVANIGKEVYVYPGSATGPVASPTLTLTAPDPQSGFGSVAASAGDVNGDGFADVVIGGPNYAGNSGRAYVYLGSASGLPTSPSKTLDAPSTGGFGASVSSAGDVNGDGYCDLLVVGNGKGDVFLGSATGVGSTPAYTLPASISAGDVNGDGFGDFVVIQSGAANVYLSSAAGPATASPIVLLTGTTIADSVAGAGDVNGDGYADIIVGAAVPGRDHEGNAYIFSGGSAGTATSPAATLSYPPGAGGDGVVFTNFGSSVAGAGDVNGDGFADVLVAAVSAGEMFLYVGRSTGLSTTPTSSIAGDLSLIVNPVGDVNGDGYTDVVVCDLQKVALNLGTGTGLTTATSAVVFTSPDGAAGPAAYEDGGRAARGRALAARVFAVVGRKKT